MAVWGENLIISGGAPDLAVQEETLYILQIKVGKSSHKIRCKVETVVITWVLKDTISNEAYSGYNLCAGSR